jgi:hypothetical protein
MDLNTCTDYSTAVLVRQDVPRIAGPLSRDIGANASRRSGLKRVKAQLRSRET